MDYVLEDNELNNILENSLNEISNTYNLSDLRDIFNKLNEAVLLIEIIDGNIKFIEKKGYESRNQSVIDLLIKANKYKKLKDIQFIIFTNDFINDEELIEYPYLLTFCKNESQENILFPNFNFNHWKEANINNYEDIYLNLINTEINFLNKEDKIFWSGAETNIIRRKMYDACKNNPLYYINLNNVDGNQYIPIENIAKYKYLLNMNGHSYGGRLNYLFISACCVIILKNTDKNKSYKEFFYDNFIPNIDYLEILYSDNEPVELIIEKINNSIKNNDTAKIAENGYKKAFNIFKMNNIYEYIHSVINHLSQKNIIDQHLDKTIMITPGLNHYFNNRINIINNQFSFNFSGNDIELVLNNNKNKINFKYMNSITKIIFNDKVVILNRRTQQLTNNKQLKNFQIIIFNNMLNVIVDRTYNVISVKLPINNFIITSLDIKTESIGWWFI